MDIFEFDRQFGCSLLGGVDEAGRGPLAGDVYAAAVILPENVVIDGLNDSKKLTEKKREALYDIIKEKAVACAVGTASVKEIDELNILNATFLAMRRAVEGLNITPELILVDGNRNPKLKAETRIIVKGDQKSASIAAASILAKVERDRYMKRLAEEYPQYEFQKHKGYGTKLHYQKLDEYGISDIHRMSFLKKYLAKAEKASEEEAAGGKNIAEKTALPIMNGDVKAKGNAGEAMVSEYLKSQGYQILFRNFHSGFGEIDIISKKDKYIVFTEVKLRKDGSLVSGEEAVSLSKQKKIVKTAMVYISENNINLQPRFDVAAVNANSDSGYDLKYIENAFGGSFDDVYF